MWMLLKLRSEFLCPPTSTAVFCRSTFENGVNWLYDHEAKLTWPWRSDLSTLMHEPAFSGLFNRTFFSELNLIRKTGNAAAHGTKITEQDALACLKYLFRFLRFLAIHYGKTTPETQVFDEAWLIWCSLSRLSLPLSFGR